MDEVKAAALAAEWRAEADMLEREAEFCGGRHQFSLYSRKCAQVAVLRRCANALISADAPRLTVWQHVRGLLGAGSL